MQKKKKKNKETAVAFDILEKLKCDLRVKFKHNQASHIKKIFFERGKFVVF